MVGVIVAVTIVIIIFFGAGIRVRRDLDLR